MSTTAYTLIDSIHNLELIAKGDYFARANHGQHYLIAGSLGEIQAAAAAARADGHVVDSQVHRSLTGSDEAEQASVPCGRC